MTATHWLMRSTLGAALALLAACAAAPQRTAPVVAAPTPAPNAATAVLPPQRTPVEPAPTHDDSPWQRLRMRFALSGCEAGDEVNRHAAEYARSPTRFAASWKSAMPFLLLVVDEIETRDLPGEFALLPYVESHYRPLAAQGNRPAGMWQLMPATARDRGLSISRHYDGRLDPIDSTRAALELIERYDREFGDWRLATMAFNAGEYRIKKALGPRATTALDDRARAQLGLSPTTYDHLARMLALACIVTDPDRFAIELPEPGEDDHLVVQAMDGPFDLRVAAGFAGVPLETFLQYNAAHRSVRSSAGTPGRLLLPVTRSTRFAEAMAKHPGALGQYWQTRKPKRPATLVELAETAGTPVEALARANGLDADARIGVDNEVLVPGQAAEMPVAEAVDDPEVLHVVRAGDTLSTLARRYGVRLADLLGWNALKKNSMLRLGMRLRVRAP